MHADAPERYHLTLTSSGRPVMHGWWGDLATAEWKFTIWVDEHGSIPDAGVVLVDTAEGERVIHSWPDES